MLKSQAPPANKHSPNEAFSNSQTVLSTTAPMRQILKQGDNNNNRNRPALPLRNRWFSICVPLPWYFCWRHLFRHISEQQYNFFFLFTQIIHTYCALTHTARWYYIVHSLYGNFNNIFASWCSRAVFVVVVVEFFVFEMTRRRQSGDLSFYSSSHTEITHLKFEMKHLKLY